MINIKLPKLNISNIFNLKNINIDKITPRNTLITVACISIVSVLGIMISLIRKSYIKNLDKIALGKFFVEYPQYKGSVIILCDKDFDKITKFAKSNGIDEPYYYIAGKGRSINHDESLLKAFSRFMVKKSKDHPLKDVDYKDIIFISNKDAENLPSQLFTQDNVIPGWQHPGYVIKRNDLLFSLEQNANFIIKSPNEDTFSNIVSIRPKNNLINPENNTDGKYETDFIEDKAIKQKKSSSKASFLQKIINPSSKLSKAILEKKEALENYNKENPVFCGEVFVLNKEEHTKLKQFVELYNIDIDDRMHTDTSGKIFIYGSKNLIAYALFLVKNSKDHPLYNTRCKDIMFVHNSYKRLIPKHLDKPENKLPGWQSPGIVLNRNDLLDELSKEATERNLYENCVVTRLDKKEYNRIVDNSNRVKNVPGKKYMEITLGEKDELFTTLRDFPEEVFICYNVKNSNELFE